MDIVNIASKKVAILGIGIEGIAMANFLIEKNIPITLLDIKEEGLLDKKNEHYLKIKKIIENKLCKEKFGKNYLDNLSDFDLLFRSPGIKYLSTKIKEAEANGTEIYSQIKLFFDLCPAPIIGVTGTKGKGTTASLIYELAKRNPEFNNVYLAGNIGKPAITLLDRLTNNDLVILELSSFQLQDLHKSPHIAVITNLGVDHLNYHKNRDEYIEAKQSIFKYQNAEDYLIVNSEVEADYYRNAKSQILKFSGDDQNNVAARIAKDELAEYSVFIESGGGPVKIVSESEIILVGKHNLENIAAATIAASILGCDIESIRDIVKKFPGLPHRLEFVSEIDNVKYYNDSFATNPEPTIAAIRSFNQNKIVILGGSSKGADFKKLAQEISISNVVSVILIGDEANNIHTSLSNEGYAGKIVEKSDDLSDALRNAKNIAHQGDVVIFSPACASFDMFKNYKDRGEQFKTIVKEMSHEQSGQKQ